MSCGWCVYLLQSIHNPRRTYVGMTSDLRRRLRQHNGEISGGARYTRSFGRWRLVTALTGFSKIDAMRFEWYAKRKRPVWKPIMRKLGWMNITPPHFPCCTANDPVVHQDSFNEILDTNTTQKNEMAEVWYQLAIDRLGPNYRPLLKSFIL